MVAVIQRVLRASVKVDGAIVGECGHGLAILLGVARGDTVEDADKLMTKISKLRIFCGIVCPCFLRYTVSQKSKKEHKR